MGDMLGVVSKRTEFKVENGRARETSKLETKAGAGNFQPTTAKLLPLFHTDVAALTVHACDRQCIHMMTMTKSKSTTCLPALVLQQLLVHRIRRQPLRTVTDLENLIVSHASLNLPHLGDLGRLLEVRQRRRMQRHQVCRRSAGRPGVSSLVDV